MNNSKVENSKKCLSIIRQFIEETPLPGKSKEMAILVLHQLQKITAGADNGLTAPDLTCSGRPRA